MNFSCKYILVGFILLCGVTVLTHCDTSAPPQKTAVVSSYLNLNDTVKYVGIETCRLCHQEIYNNFIQTGMGQSFDIAHKKKSSAKFNQSVVYDRESDFYYHAYWDGDSLKINEFRLKGKDTVHQRSETVDYIIGSGQHTNSHIFNVNGYLHQLPMTFYTQESRWDLPPGYENGGNTRFSRKIGIECMTCHNAYPEFTRGSENHYNAIPSGINCERCHGPGGEHVRQKSLGIKVDTARAIDYSIVNPAKLPIDLQFDVCQRCHLQGNAVLKEGKSFYDFKPGMKLSDVMTVFLPKYSGAEKEFIMASHADRLKMSSCFTKSFKSAETNKSLRPYKSALTCVTCHNPHISVKKTGSETFNAACTNCHAGANVITCSEKPDLRAQHSDNCVSCHMPKSGSIDIPHVRVTDHFIRKPVKETDVAAIKKFLGLVAINETNPSPLLKAQAYLNQFEKFNTERFLLDSAKNYLQEDVTRFSENFPILVRWAYLKNDFTAIIRYTGQYGIDKLLQQTLVNKSYTNDDAWTNYRIGEAFYKQNDITTAYRFYEKAVTLAPLNPEFRNKQASALVAMKRVDEARRLFETLLKENPKFVPAYTNLGYICFISGDKDKALKLYQQGILLDPDNEPLLMNIAGFYISANQQQEALKVLRHLLARHPDNVQAKSVLKRLNLKS